jgi:cytochrome P450
MLMVKLSAPTNQRLPRKVRNLRGLAFGLIGDELEFFMRLGATSDDMVRFSEWGEQYYFVNSPAIVQEVLVSKGRHFTKSRALEKLSKIVGRGLLTSESDFHRQQRRLIQPLFHAQSISGCAGAIVEQTTALMEGWRDGEKRDLSDDMVRLALNSVCRAIIGSDLDPEAAKVRAASDTFMQNLPLLMMPFSNVLERLPLPAIRRLRRVREELDRIIYRLIETRRQNPMEGGSLLTMLLAAQDAEGEAGAGMTDEQVRDEVMIMFLAGHETVATALSWTWFLLGQHPQSEAKFHAELAEVLPGRRSATAEDFPRLAYTRQVVNESLRLYPPLWLISRRAITDCEIGGYNVPAGTIVLMSQWVLHRDPKLFENPSQFLPERWTPQFESSLPKISYFPFGGGVRRCIGDGFALLELVLGLATIGQRWRFRIEDPNRVVPRPALTLRLKNGLPVTLERR